MKDQTIYESPSLEIVTFSCVDIITTSNPKNNIDEDEGNNDGEWAIY